MQPTLARPPPDNEKEFFMKSRKPTNPSVDRKIFRNTAAKVKAVNLPQKIYRGGIRF